MHVLIPKKDKSVVVGKLVYKQRHGHVTLKCARYQDRRDNRCRTRATKNQRALADW